MGFCILMKRLNFFYHLCDVLYVSFSFIAGFPILMGVLKEERDDVEMVSQFLFLVS